MNNTDSIFISFENDIFGAFEKTKYEENINLINNYKNLINNNIMTLEMIIGRSTNKSYIIYNLGTIIELFFKYILFSLSSYDKNSVSNLNHAIFEIYKKIKEHCYDSNIVNKCDFIINEVKKIKMDNGNSINYNDYTDFRYNHKKRDFNLIFTKNITKKEIIHIKEVLECIKLVMNL